MKLIIFLFIILIFWDAIKLLRLNVKINFVKGRPGHDIRYALNSSKIIKNLKWKPKINIYKGLIKTFDWYLKNPGYYSKLKKKDILKRLGNKRKW